MAPIGHHRLRGHPVGGHADPRPPQDVAAGDMVVEGVEPTRRIMLGTAVEHALERSNLVHALGVADGPSRLSALIRVPPFLRRASMKQGPFAPDGLCCPAARSLLRPPPTPSRAAVHFPGSPVIGRRASRRRRPGAEEGLSSSQDNLLTVPRPLRRGVLRRPLQVPRRLPWPSPVGRRARLPLVPPNGGRLTTLQASLHAADRPVAHPQGVIVAPLRRRPLDRRREPHYRGPWRLPGPDSHRLAALNLSLGYVTLTSLSSWRPNCWAHHPVFAASGIEPEYPLYGEFSITRTMPLGGLCGRAWG